MRYKNPGTAAKTRELRRLWEVRVYEGDPDARIPKTKYTTVVAFNAVEAIRLCGGRAASEPVALDYVTWPEHPGDPVLRIQDTSGPTDQVVEPIVPLSAEEDEDWGEDKFASDTPKPDIKIKRRSPTTKAKAK